MITISLVLIVVALLAGGVAHPRTRYWFVVKDEPKALASGDSTSLTEWKAIFRDTVIAAEGKLSPEMEVFLTNGDALVDAFLTKARAAAEKDCAELVEKTKAECAAVVKKTEEERAAILTENEEWVTNKRPLLMGAPLKEFEDDYALCSSGIEKGEVLCRWHNKGFRFSTKLRMSILWKCTKTDEGAVARKWLRALFDEQDKPE